MTPRETETLLDVDDNEKRPLLCDGRQQNQHQQQHLSISSSYSTSSFSDNDDTNKAPTSTKTKTSTQDAARSSKAGRALLMIVGCSVLLVYYAVAIDDGGGNHSNRLRSKVHTLAEALANKTAPTTNDDSDSTNDNTNDSTNDNDSNNNDTSNSDNYTTKQGTGPYELIEAHKGKSFFDYYDFFDGPDSVGSAGYQTYVGRERADELKLARVVAEKVEGNTDNNNDNDDDDDTEFVYLSSKSGTSLDENNNRFRESIRLEGKHRFDHGLIILDVDQMPTGCGVWPAFWTTDEAHWPDYGEIDIVEPINNQIVAKTALHTSEGCDMFAHVPRWNWTGHWDSATGLPDTFTGTPNFDSTLEADNCYALTPHQWANQGCVAIHDRNDTIGEPMNRHRGGVYALEWDPYGGYIRSWVFARNEIPDNLQHAVSSSDGDSDSTTTNTNTNTVRPDPSGWPTPYAYFAIGEGSGCPSERFRNHRLVINLAFCGAVAGNRFARDCPDLYEKYKVDDKNDSVAACNAYLESDEARQLMDDDVFWKIGGVYLYQREEDN